MLPVGCGHGSYAACLPQAAGTWLSTGMLFCWVGMEPASQARWLVWPHAHWVAATGRFLAH